MFLGESAVGRALQRLNQQSRFLDWAGKEAHFPGNPAAVNHRFERVGGKLGEAIAGYLDCPLGASETLKFSEGNLFVRVLDNVEGALACELLGSLAATDFRRPLKSGAGTHAAYECARERIAPWTADRVPAPDIEAARELIGSGVLVHAAQTAIGEPL